jgi:hypothetical protein
MTVDNNDFTRERLYPLGCIVGTVVLRFFIYVWLYSKGYFYGIPWDSFSRTLMSYEWSKHPFFAPSDGYWLPLQFYIVGSIYKIIRPLNSTSDILVPIIINNIFFVGSLIITFSLVRNIVRKIVSAFLCILVAVFAGDIFVSYTALSEPILIFFILLAS